jgi:hypothetical protein
MSFQISDNISPGSKFIDYKDNIVQDIEFSHGILDTVEDVGKSHQEILL